MYGFPLIDNVNTEFLELYIEHYNNSSPDLRVLWDLEDELGISRMELARVEGNSWYLKGDEFWVRTTLHLSSVTYIIRALFAGCTTWDEVANHENYWNFAPKFRQAIFDLKEKNYRVVNPRYKSAGNYDFHELSGIYSYILEKNSVTKLADADYGALL
jgi:hypothetical protein